MNGSMQHRRSVAGIVAVLVALVIAAPMAQAQSNVDPRVVAPNDARALTGKTYGEWSAEWWKYVFSLPLNRNPLDDNTGRLCSEAQSAASPVFFLVGTLAGPSPTRTCTVKAGKFLFIPLVNVAWDNLGNVRALSQGRLREIAGDLERSTTELHATVDGMPVGNLSSFRTKSAAFYYTMPATGNIYGVSCTGTTSPTCTDANNTTVPFGGLTCTATEPRTCTALAVGDGFYLLLKPLSVGSHTINFGGTFGPPYDFPVNVTYNLQVVP